MTDSFFDRFDGLVPKPTREADVKPVSQRQWWELGGFDVGSLEQPNIAHRVAAGSVLELARHLASSITTYIRKTIDQAVLRGFRLDLLGADPFEYDFGTWGVLCDEGYLDIVIEPLSGSWRIRGSDGSTLSDEDCQGYLLTLAETCQRACVERQMTIATVDRDLHQALQGFNADELVEHTRTSVQRATRDRDSLVGMTTNAVDSWLKITEAILWFGLMRRTARLEVRASTIGEEPSHRRMLINVDAEGSWSLHLEPEDLSSEARGVHGNDLFRFCLFGSSRDIYFELAEVGAQAFRLISS